MCLGVPGEVVELDSSSSELPAALVQFAGVRRRVCMACVPEAKKGDFVIVHAGIAISRINPEEAQRVLNYLKQIGENDGWDRGLSPNHGDRQQQYAS